MTAIGDVEIARTDSIGPEAIDAADFEQDIVTGLADLVTFDAELLFERDFAIDFYVERAWVKVFAGGFAKSGGEFGHAPAEIAGTFDYAAF
jgi:hypothetical protein